MVREEAGRGEKLGGQGWLVEDPASHHWGRKEGTNLVAWIVHSQLGRKPATAGHHTEPRIRHHE